MPMEEDRIQNSKPRQLWSDFPATDESDHVSDAGTALMEIPTDASLEESGATAFHDPSSSSTTPPYAIPLSWEKIIHVSR